MTAQVRAPYASLLDADRGGYLCPFAVQIETVRISPARVAQSVSGGEGSVMIEAKITYYVFFLGAAAVASMLAYQIFEMILA